MSRNIVQINEIRRFEKSDQKTKKKEIFKLRSFAHEVKRDFITSELQSRSKKVEDYSVMSLHSSYQGLAQQNIQLLVI